MDMRPIAHIKSDFSEKFGIPRQSGLVEGLTGKIVFEPPFRSPEAVRGLEQFSHIWLLWGFSQAKEGGLTVRPPRLGGNTRLGVFATRSPFRPNNIGLSSVRLLAIRRDPSLGPVLLVEGADLLDGTPIYDIKPYLPYTDSHPNASEGYTARTRGHALQVEFPPALLSKYPEEKRQAAVSLLSQDPRPGYSHDPSRIYGMPFAGYDIRFTVEGDTLRVADVVELDT